MKRLLSYLSLAFSAVLFSQEVRTTLSKDSIRIGEQFELSIYIQEKIKPINFPVILDSLGPFEVISTQSKIDTLSNGYLRKKYILTSFEPGNQVYHKLKIETGNKSYLSRLQVVVADVEVDIEAAEKPIKGILKVEYSFWELVQKYYLYAVLAFLLILILSLLIWTIVLQSKKRKKEKKVKTPKDEALFLLRELDQKKWEQKGEIKKYYSELDKIVRRYLSRRFHFSTRELLSRELFQKIEEKEALIEADLIRYRDFLSDTDLAKFASQEHSQKRHKDNRKLAEEIVLNTQPIVEENATEDE